MGTSHMNGNVIYVSFDPVNSSDLQIVLHNVIVSAIHIKVQIRARISHTSLWFPPMPLLQLGIIIRGIDLA